MAKPTAEPDLTDCDREPIHIPGSVQPHGLLLAVEPETLRVLQAAGDTAGMLGLGIGDLIGQAVDAVLDAGWVSSIRSSLAAEPSEPLYLGTLPAPGDPGRVLDLTAHLRDSVLVLEFEPGTPDPKSAAEILARVRKAGAQLEAAPDLNRLLQAANREIRRLTGFDRVMIYRFHDDGTGSVDAEDAAEGIDRLLNHRYPASDIPKQARALYLRNPIRVIPDAHYAPAPLDPVVNPLTGEPLDMSECVLRSVSPIHVQYLHNMGVAASMSVSIVVHGTLWGLVSCHHMTAKLVPYELREVCKHLGQILGQQVRARDEAEQHRQTLRLAAARDDFLSNLARADSIEQALLDGVDLVGALLPADGAAVSFRGEARRSGHAPAADQVRDLAEWLLRCSPSAPYVTDSLGRQYAPAQSYSARASGLVATVISRYEPLVLMWFRAEQIETINWAGNPHKPVEPGEELGSLTPRKSFEAWKETVRRRSRPWSTAEIEAARRLGRAIFDLRQQKMLQDLNLQLRQALSDKEALIAQKDLLMQEVNHRVQNSLQLVTSMLQTQARQIPDAEMRAHFEEASHRIVAVSSVHQRLWRSDHIRHIDFGAYLEELCDGLIATWGNAWMGYIEVDAPPVLIPTDRAVVMALVVTELLTNAVKYAYEGEPGPIHVTMREEGRKALRVTVRDDGVGTPTIEAKGGLGSRLTRSLVEQLGGELEREARSTGTSVTFTAPVIPR
ncbi:MAG TPA: histidine kinase dimerization/phosphoacceptor domain -containing protein [Kaistia sp.]|nr:histidine kinase dimerization/phosphoacceptor domain -containing protein [Kaistia sp.]